MKVTGGDVALKLTGYSPGGINPFGMDSEIPIYLTKNISEIDVLCF